MGLLDVVHTSFGRLMGREHVNCAAGKYNAGYGRSEPCDADCDAGYFCPSRSVNGQGATCDGSGCSVFFFRVYSPSCTFTSVSTDCV